MKHLRKARKFGRTAGPRKLMLKNLARQLILHEEITTTVAKAKEIRSLVDRIITIGKRGDLNARRLIIKKVGSRIVAKKIIEDLGPKYATRPGGYTRIIRIGRRKGDCAEIAKMELV